MFDVRKLALTAAGLGVLTPGIVAAPQSVSGPHIQGVPGTIPPTPPPQWLGDKKLAIILIDLVNVPYIKHTPAQAQQLVFTNAKSTVNFWDEASYGRFRVTGDVFGPVGINFDPVPCDRKAWAQAAIDELTNDAHIAFDKDDYDLIGYSSSSGCSSTGLPDLDPPGAYMNNLSLLATTHELGHGLGLAHSSETGCNGPVASGNCAITFFEEYGDRFDAMGTPNAYTYNQQKRGQLGWLDPVNTLTVTTAGMYDVFPIESFASTLKVLRVPRVSGPFGIEQYFYVELRQPTFFDDFDPTDPEANGTLLRLARPYNRQGRSYIIDVTPETPELEDAVMIPPAGGGPAVYRDPVSGTAIKTWSVTKTGSIDTTFATVEILPGVVLDCAYGDPEVTFGVANNTITAFPGVPVDLPITLQNGDSVFCPFVPIAGSWTGQNWGPEALLGFERTLYGDETTQFNSTITVPPLTDPDNYPVTLTVTNLYTGYSTQLGLTVDVQ